MRPVPGLKPVICTAAVVDVHPRRRISLPSVSYAGMPCTRCGVNRSRFPFGNRALPMFSILQDGNCAGCRSLPLSAEGILEVQRHQDPESPAEIYASFSRRQRAGVPGGARKGIKARNQVPEAFLSFIPRLIPRFTAAPVSGFEFQGSAAGASSALDSTALQRGSAKLGRRKPVRGITDRRQPPFRNQGARAGEGKAETGAQGRRRFQWAKSLRPCNPFSGRLLGRGASFPRAPRTSRRDLHRYRFCTKAISLSNRLRL